MCVPRAVALWTLVVLTAAQPLCDPITQFLLRGECCQKCKPGTSMMPTGTCRDPVCKDCEENEYTDTYTNETKCERQPYCDPNKNFIWATHTSKTKKTTCLCKEGFHCSSEACIICVAHTVCEEGFGAVTIGNQLQDTVCDKCKEGTFSDEVSWNGTCKEMAGCTFGTYSKGSSASHNNCEKLQNWHIGLIVAGALGVAAVVAIFFLFRYQKKKAYGKLNLKCVEKQLEDEPEPKSPIASPTDDTSYNYCPISPIYHHSGPPEENEDVVRTDNGHKLSQDEKEHIISQPETQGFDLLSLNNN